MIEQIIAQKSRGNPTLVLTTRTKLILKGFNPDKFTDMTPDDPGAIAKLAAVAHEMGIEVRSF